LTNHTYKIQKGQLNRNAKYDNKRQLKRHGGSNIYSRYHIKELFQRN
jgi:hypothetical protein